MALIFRVERDERPGREPERARHPPGQLLQQQRNSQRRKNIAFFSRHFFAF